MLNLKNITKDYVSGDSVVHALRGVSLEFRKNEFVSILGQSGCGKTTLLNIIGGLDKYSDGDLVINGKSTKNFADRDWDTYRNHSIGFIFQSYNLIPHQTVLSNVELALTLSGVSKKERRERAKQALIKVGLGDQINKKPNQMSGGQMQRVAIARALVNNPDILLADEPTGALDSETSVQIMDLIKEIANDRLVIMVTHNPELAEQYSTRIINLLDGLVVNDSNPYDSSMENAENAGESVENSEQIATQSDDLSKATEESQKSDTSSDENDKKAKKTKKTSMSFFTAFLLSLNNLLTKKGRTILTSFAGSIGIIGIALIFAVSNGTNKYIEHVQESTLSSYPLTIESESIDLSALIQTILNPDGGDSTSEETKSNRDDESVYKDDLIKELVEAISKTEVTQNDLVAFKSFIERELDKPDSDLYNAISEVQYEYALDLNVYTKNYIRDENGNKIPIKDESGKIIDYEHEIIKSDTMVLLQEMLQDFFVQSGLLTESESSSMFGGMSNSTSSTGGMSMFTMGSTGMWQEILPDSKNDGPISSVIYDQYDLIYGSWPNEYDEIFLVVDEDNELDDLTLYALGLIDKAEIDKIIKHASTGTPLPEAEKEPAWTFNEICNEHTYKVILPSDFYVTYDGETVIDQSKNPNYLSTLYDNALELKVTGIIRLKDGVDRGYMSGAIGYTNKLTQYVINESSKLTDENGNQTVVGLQYANKNFDVIARLPFKSASETLTDEEKKADFVTYVEKLTPAEKAQLYLQIATLDALNKLVDDTTTETTDDKVTRLELETKKQLASITNKESAIAYVSGILLNSGMIAQDEKEALITAVKISYDEANGAGAYDALTQEQKDGLLYNKLAQQYKLDGYDYETLKAQIATPLAKQVAMITVSTETSFMVNMAYPNPEDKINALNTILKTASDKEIAIYYDNLMKFSESTYEKNLILLGKIDLDSPSAIKLYTATFEQKDKVKEIIDGYNSGEGKDHPIKYSDFMGEMMKSITTIIDAITYVLIAFVATSLIVSSIMIGVITLISVQERTKEIGVLRAMGASKRDVSRVFNAETLIVGFAAGVIGILITLILTAIINVVLLSLTGLVALKASLGFLPAILLIAISMGLTLIAGLIPSRVAAKKDPVIALRSE